MIYGLVIHIFKWVSSAYMCLAYIGYYTIYLKYGLLALIDGYDIWGNITYMFKWVISSYTSFILSSMSARVWSVLEVWVMIRAVLQRPIMPASPRQNTAQINSQS